jgi:hypothetical protein
VPPATRSGTVLRRGVEVPCMGQHWGDDLPELPSGRSIYFLFFSYMLPIILIPFLKFLEQRRRPIVVSPLSKTPSHTPSNHRLRGPSVLPVNMPVKNSHLQTGGLPGGSMKCGRHNVTEQLYGCR